MAEEVQVATDGLTRRQKLVLTIGSAILVAVAFQAMLMARNNYSLWRFEVTAYEMGLALVGSLLANLVPGLDDRGRQWASTYEDLNKNWLNHLNAILPGVLVRAALMTLCLSAVNATVIPLNIYRETVELPVLAVFVRFLADIPAAVLLCLIVRIAVGRMRR